MGKKSQYDQIEQLLVEGVPPVPESRSTKDELWEHIETYRNLLGAVRTTLLQVYATQVAEMANNGQNPDESPAGLIPLRIGDQVIWKETNSTADERWKDDPSWEEEYRGQVINFNDTEALLCVQLGGVSGRTTNRLVRRDTIKEVIPASAAKLPVG